MKATFTFIPVLLLVSLVGCGDSNSTADNTETEQLKERIASLEKKLEAKQKPDSASDTEAKKEAPKRAVAAATHRTTPAEEKQKQGVAALLKKASEIPIQEKADLEKALASYLATSSSDEKLEHLSDIENLLLKFYQLTSYESINKAKAKKLVQEVRNLKVAEGLLALEKKLENPTSEVEKKKAELTSFTRNFLALPKRDTSTSKKALIAYLTAQSPEEKFKYTFLGHAFEYELEEMVIKGTLESDLYDWDFVPEFAKGLPDFTVLDVGDIKETTRALVVFDSNQNASLKRIDTHWVFCEEISTHFKYNDVEEVSTGGFCLSTPLDLIASGEFKDPKDLPGDFRAKTPDITTFNVNELKEFGAPAVKRAELYIQTLAAAKKNADAEVAKGEEETPSTTPTPKTVNDTKTEPKTSLTQYEKAARDFKFGSAYLGMSLKDFRAKFPKADYTTANNNSDYFKKQGLYSAILNSSRGEVEGPSIVFCDFLNGTLYNMKAWYPGKDTDEVELHALIAKIAKTFGTVESNNSVRPWFESRTNDIESREETVWLCDFRRVNRAIVFQCSTDPAQDRPLLPTAQLQIYDVSAQKLRHSRQRQLGIRTKPFDSAVLKWLESRKHPGNAPTSSGDKPKTSSGDKPETITALRTLTGHSDDVHSVAFSPDGKRIVSGSSDGSVRVWNADNGKELHTLYGGHEQDVLSVAFSPDGKRIVSGARLTAYQTIIIWDVDTGQKIKGSSFTGFEYVTFSPDGKRIIGVSRSDRDDIIHFLDAERGKEFNSLLKIKRPQPGNNYAGHRLGLSPDGTLLASTVNVSPKNRPYPRDDRIIIWNVDPSHAISDQGKELRSIKMGFDNYSACGVAFSPDGKRIVSGGGDRIKIWDVVSGEELQTLKGHSKTVNSVAFSPDGKWIVSGSSDQTVRIWDSFSGQQLLTLKGHTGYGVYSVAWSPDGKQIVSGGEDNTLKIWDISSLKP